MNLWIHDGSIWAPSHSRLMLMWIYMVKYFIDRDTVVCWYLEQRSWWIGSSMVSWPNLTLFLLVHVWDCFFLFFFFSYEFPHLTMNACTFFLKKMRPCSWCSGVWILFFHFMWRFCCRTLQKTQGYSHSCSVQKNWVCSAAAWLPGMNLMILPANSTPTPKSSWFIVECVVLFSRLMFIFFVSQCVRVFFKAFVHGGTPLTIRLTLLLTLITIMFLLKLLLSIVLLGHAAKYVLKNDALSTATSQMEGISQEHAASLLQTDRYALVGSRVPWWWELICTSSTTINGISINTIKTVNTTNSINQPINQSISQSINQSVNQSINQCPSSTINFKSNSSQICFIEPFQFVMIENFPRKL